MVHSEYGRLTANSCCCAACRDLGFFGFHLLREIVKLIFANLASEAPHFCSGKVVLERIDGGGVGHQELDEDLQEIRCCVFFKKCPAYP